VDAAAGRAGAAVAGPAFRCGRRDGSDLCADDAFDVRSLRAAMIANQQWKGKTGESNANRIGDWLAADEGRRAEGIEDLWSVFFAKGRPRASASLEKIDPDYPAMSCAWARGSPRCARWRRWWRWRSG
jgi:hypothetical protein